MKNSLSHTAAYIAVKFYGLTLNPKIAEKFDPFLPSFYKEAVNFLPSHLSWNLKALKSRFWRNFFVRWEELLLPGDLMHIISRKYYIHQILERLINENSNLQIVILGSGFDHSAAFWSQKSIHCFEIDTDEMIQMKGQFLDNSAYKNEYLHLAPIDKSDQSLNRLLKTHPNFSPNKKTVFLAEGFFDYLTLEHTKSIIDQISGFKETTLISTFFDLKELNFFHRFMFTSGVALVGESLKLPLDRSGFKSLLSNYELNLKNEISYQKAEQELVKGLDLEIDLPVLKGFYILESSN